jgi:hypothetical protein
VDYWDLENDNPAPAVIHWVSPSVIRPIGFGLLILGALMLASPAA